MSAHTATPWTLTTVQTSCGICHKIGPFPPKPGSSRENHACVYADYPGNGPHDAELLANARLIAAAPDLLDNLICAQDWLEEMSITDDAENKSALSHALRYIAAAIAKATGKLK